VRAPRTDAEAGQHGRNWSNVVSSLAAFATVLVAIAALMSTNAANLAQQRITERGQLSDRFSRAVEQVGSDKLSIRLGGIFSMERLMRDARPEQPTIVRILAQFVRDRAPVRPGAGAGRSARSYGVAADVQAALTALVHRPDTTGSGGRLDLRAADLSGADLSGGDLSRAVLADADISHADLSRARLVGADLINTGLGGTNLANADLSGARLMGADISQANLSGARLQDADLAEATLSGADLRTAKDLTVGQLAAGRSDASTKLPDGIAPPRPGDSRPVIKVTTTAQPRSGSVAGCRDGVVITFTAQITVSQPTTIRYRWERSDGAIDTNIYQPIVFRQPGSRAVTTTWYRGGRLGEVLEGSQYLVVENQYPAVSTKGDFSLLCTS
jgi:hypothetical protein